MKKHIVILLMSCLGMQFAAQAQRKVSELTLTYDASISSGSKEPKMADALDGHTKTIYVKGNMSRAELASALFSSATIHVYRSSDR